MSYPPTNNPQQVQTVTNILSDEKSYIEVKFAITGDPHADLIAGLSAVSGVHTSRTGLSARQVQFAFEYLAKLWKDAADDNEKRLSAMQKWAGPVTEPFTNPVPYITSAVPLLDSNQLQKLRDSLASGVGGSVVGG